MLGKAPEPNVSEHQKFNGSDTVSKAVDASYKRVYLHQAGVVSDLLLAAELVLADGSKEAAEGLRAALDNFEHYTAPVAYGVDDVPDADDKLSNEDKLDVLNVFAAEYEVKDSDWEALHYIVNKTHGE